MKRVMFFSLLVFTAFFCRAQSPELTRIKAALPKIKDSLRYVDALNRMVMLLYEQNEDSAFYYTKKARAIADRHDYNQGRADALNNLGVFFDIKGNLQLALRYYNEGFDVYRTIKDSANMVQATMNIAMVYKELGKDQRAVTYFDNSLALGKKLRRDSIMSLAIYNYILAYPAHFSTDTVSSFIAKARQIATRYNDERTLVAVDQLTADDMITHDSRDAGLALLQKTIERAMEKKLYYVSMDMIIDMGDQLAKDDTARAAQYYRQGLTIADRNGYLIYSEALARKLFDLYTANNDNLTAAFYSRRLINLHDEQQKLDAASGIDYLDYALKEEQLNSLTTRSRYTTALLAVSGLAFLLAIAVIIITRRNLKRTRDQNSQMQKALTALEQSQQDNTRMMQIVAHDLRNPIGAVQTMASMLLRETDRPGSDHALLEMIETSAKKSLQLVSEMLEVQFSTEELKKEPVDIAEMLSYCVNLLQNKAEAKGQHIYLETTPVTLQASREKLWRVISNLIGNAIKFSPSGAPIMVTMERRQQNIRICVKDEGIGIQPAMKDKIFDMFTEAKRPGTAGEPTFGLGLAISKQIVEAHGGNIWFESQQGKGTMFFVDLPDN